MPKPKLMIHACTLGVTLTSSMLVSANTAPWNGSYAAKGECFCSGIQSREIDSRIMPTPVGGQSVSQICDRVGKGPTLMQKDGEYNFSVFSDPQCGHGPFASDQAKNDADVKVGPKWDLKTAYSRPAPIKPTSVSQALPEPELGVTEAPPVTGGSRYILPPKRKISSTGSEVKNVAKPRQQSNKVVKQVAKAKVEKKQLTTEELKARLLVHMEAARARLNKEEQAKSKVEAQAKAQVQTEAQAKAQEDALAKAQAQAEAEAREKAASEALAKAQAQAEAEALAKAQAQAEAEALAKAQAQAEAEALAKAQAEAKAAQQVEAEAASKAERAASVESVASTTKNDASKESVPSLLSALKMPPSTRNSAQEFDYIEGAPVSYDFGGAGMRVAASLSNQDRVQILLQASAAETYREAFLGLGLYLSPRSAERLTLLLTTGIEYGKFEFQGEQVDAPFSDTGAYIGLSSRFVVNNRFELQAGVGYSSFFEGDAIVFGSAFYHITPKLDLTTKAEGGDNDSFGFGIRYYY